MRSIEAGLLEERGEIIRRLKVELNELEEQNDLLRMELNSRHYDWEEEEMKYKKSLMQMRF
jgi:hypothetical protein